MTRSALLAALLALALTACGQKEEEAPAANDAWAALGLTAAMVAKLQAAGVETPDQLKGKTVEELVDLPGIGEATAKKIFAAVETMS